MDELIGWHKEARDLIITVAEVFTHEQYPGYSLWILTPTVEVPYYKNVRVFYGQTGNKPGRALFDIFLAPEHWNSRKSDIIRIAVETIESECSWGIHNYGSKFTRPKATTQDKPLPQ